MFETSEKKTIFSCATQQKMFYYLYYLLCLKKLCLTILLTIINFQFDEKYMFTLFALHLG
jgi:hypothetical protein